MELDRRQKIINFTVTLIQYVTLLWFIYDSPWVARGWLAQTVELSGIALAVWAIYVMNESRIHIAPRPRPGARLIEKGPYRLIRHPMYLSIVLAVTPLILTQYDRTRLVVTVVLFANLVVKMLFEESLLKAHFEGYGEYMKRTYRLVPFLF